MAKDDTGKKQIYPYNKIDLSPDPNTNEVISDILSRCKQGMDKFGLTMRSLMLKNPKDALYFLNNSYEEKIDDIRYTKEAIQSFRNLNEEHKLLKIKYEKLKQENKNLKEQNKLLYEHP
nr:hypothetical protein [uncultured Mediterranean phage uvMED]